MLRAIIGAVIFFVFYFPTMIGALYTFGVINWAFDRQFYVDVLDDPALYEALLDEDLTEAIAVAMLESESQRLVDVQTNRAISLAVNAAIGDNPEYLREQVVGVVNSLFAWFDGDARTLAFEVDLVPFKEAVTGEKRDEIARILADELPACDAEQAARFAGSALYQCIPNDLSRDQAALVIADQLPTYVQSLPDQLTWEDPDAAWIGGGSIRAFINIALIGFAISAIFTWVIMSLIGGKGLRGFLIWMGVTLIIPAGIVLLTGLPLSAGALSVEGFGLQQGMINVNGQPVSAELREGLANAVVQILSRVGSGFVTVGGLSIGIGIALAAVGLFVTKRRDDEDDYEKRKVYTADDKDKRA